MLELFLLFIIILLIYLAFHLAIPILIGWAIYKLIKSRNHKLNILKRKKWYEY